MLCVNCASECTDGCQASFWSESCANWVCANCDNEHNGWCDDRDDDDRAFAIEENRQEARLLRWEASREEW